MLVSVRVKLSVVTTFVVMKILLDRRTGKTHSMHIFGARILEQASLALFPFFIRGDLNIYITVSEHDLPIFTEVK